MVTNHSLSVAPDLGTTLTIIFLQVAHIQGAVCVVKRGRSGDCCWGASWLEMGWVGCLLMGACRSGYLGR